MARGSYGPGNKPGGGRGRGRGRGGSRGGRGKGGGRGGGGRGQRWGAPRAEIPRANRKLQEYYNGLGIIPEEEQETFWDILKSDLPNSFRFAGSRGHALTVQQRLIDHYIPEITAVEYEGAPVAPPTPVEWYPDKLAWSMTTPKNVIRRFPPFASFQKFLVSENSVGNITRQEIVSMIPPLLLDIKPGMTVLDLCAAPGSKSAQIIELVHGGEEARIRKVLEKVATEDGHDLAGAGSEVELSKEQAATEDDYSDDGRATGLLIANDVDYRRAQMLIHQCKRLNSANLIVVNHDATLFPSIRIPSEFGQRYLKFDRILADVPCSGDGTLRKNPEIWKEWLPSKGLGLHTTQVRILVRALQMLKVGGKVVYSTCSMNPIENEAVIASAIDRCGGLSKVQLIDQSAALSGLKRKPGVTNWKVMDKKGRWWNKWDDVAKSKEEDGEEGMSKLVEGMFPPTSDEQIPLDHCIRIYPHLQDTGGFFIAVLEKQSEIKARPENTPKSTTAAITTPVAASTGPSIMSIVNEIQSETDAQANGLAHLSSIDKILPPQIDKDNNMDSHNAPAAARQNQANSPTFAESSSLKRALDSEADAAATTKRVKTRDEPDEPAEAGAEQRQVHWPPPPGAELELTAHQHDDNAGAPRSGAVAGHNRNHQNQNPHEEPFKYLPPDHPELASIYAFYGLSPRFPRDRFMVRNATGQPVKAIYYTSTLARDILVENEGKGLKFVHCGVKMFVKQDVQNQPDACKWRIQSEGLPIIEAWISDDRVVRVRKREELRRLLVEMFPKLSSEGWQDLGDVGEQARKLGMGCCVLRVEPTEAQAGSGTDGEGFDEHLVMPLWRGLGSVNLMLPKEERKAMLLRLFNDDSPLVDHSKDKQDRARDREARIEVKLERDDKSVVEDDGRDGGEDGDSPFKDEDGDDAVKREDKDVESVDTLGGVVANTAATQAGVEERAEQKEDALLAKYQHEKDTATEVAPGVYDEEDVFNTTV